MSLPAVPVGLSPALYSFLRQVQQREAELTQELTAANAQLTVLRQMTAHGYIAAAGQLVLATTTALSTFASATNIGSITRLGGGQFQVDWATRLPSPPLVFVDCLTQQSWGHGIAETETGVLVQTFLEDQVTPRDNTLVRLCAILPISLTD